MSWTALTVTWKKAAEKDMRGLSKKDQAQIRETVDHFAATGEGDFKKMNDGSGYRIRVRDRRVFVEITWSAKTMEVLSVTTRGDAY